MQLLQDDHALLRYLTDMEEFGFVLIKKAGRRPGEVERFSDRVSFHRTTHYGYVWGSRTLDTAERVRLGWVHALRVCLG